MKNPSSKHKEQKAKVMLLLKLKDKSPTEGLEPKSSKRMELYLYQLFLLYLQFGAPIKPLKNATIDLL